MILLWSQNVSWTHWFQQKVFKGKLLRSRLDSLVTSGEKEIENLTFSDPFQKRAFGYNSLSQKLYKVWGLLQQGMTINLKPQNPSWDGRDVPWPAALVKLIDNIWPQRIKMCKEWEVRFSLLQTAIIFAMPHDLSDCISEQSPTSSRLAAHRWRGRDVGQPLKGGWSNSYWKCPGDELGSFSNRLLASKVSWLYQVAHFYLNSTAWYAGCCREKVSKRRVKV